MTLDQLKCNKKLSQSKIKRILRLYRLQPELFDKIIYIDDLSTKHLYFTDKYSNYKANFERLTVGKYPTIQSVIDKIKYCKNKIDEKVPSFKETFKVKEVYKNGRILIEDEYGELKVYMNHIINNYKPTINTAVNKKEYYINQVNKIHDNEYTYPNLNYIDENSKINVFCKKHGEFEVVACSHKSGKKCNKCQNEKHPGKYNTTNAEKNKEEWLNIKSNYYILKIYNNEEEFYKIGISNNVINRKNQIIRGSNYKYKCKIIEEFEYNLYDIVKVEDQVKNSSCFKKYTPKIKFQGYTECFKR